jgi:acyl carrier protein
LETGILPAVDIFSVSLDKKTGKMVRFSRNYTNKHGAPLNMDDLKRQIKELIVNALELEDIKPENIVDSEPIFGEGLGLDSIDALELGIALKKKFGIKFSSENAENRKHFVSVDSLAAYIVAETSGR